MAAAEHERSRSIESLEQYDGLTGKAGQKERDHEERDEQRESRHAGASRNRKPQLRGGQRRLATAKTKSGDRPERNCRNLPEGAPDDDDDEYRGKRDHRPRAIRRERSRHAPDGLRHYGDGHELETMQECFGDMPSKSRRAERKGEQDQGGRHGETEPCR